MASSAPAIAIPTLAQVKATYLARVEQQRALKQLYADKSPEGKARFDAHLKAGWAKAAEEKRAKEAAYPGEFAKALADYTQHLREVVAKAIKEQVCDRHISYSETNKPWKAAVIQLDTYGPDNDHGSEEDEPLWEEKSYMMDWKCKENDEIEPWILLTKSEWRKGLPDVPTPLEMLKEELEALGYTLTFKSVNYKWKVKLSIPLE